MNRAKLLNLGMIIIVAVLAIPAIHIGCRQTTEYARISIAVGGMTKILGIT